MSGKSRTKFQKFTRPSSSYQQNDRLKEEKQNEDENQIPFQITKHTNPQQYNDKRSQLDLKMGFPLFPNIYQKHAVETDEKMKLGWLVNMRMTVVPAKGWETGKSAVDLYFVCEDGSCFKTNQTFSPYFYLLTRERKEAEVEGYLMKKFGKLIEKTQRCYKEDLELPNHLTGLKRQYIQVFFRNMVDLNECKKTLMPAIKKNILRKNSVEAYTSWQKGPNDDSDQENTQTQTMESGINDIMDIREHDVPYIARICIDLDYRVGLWYAVSEENGYPKIERSYEKVLPAEPVILAFDIETSKAPLKFPDANVDPIIMISYMIDGQGYLITNREIVSEDLEDFEYSPKPGEYDGPFIVFNELDEKALLMRFFEHIQQVKPAVFVTYNGDFFDWPYIEQRAKIYNLNMSQEIGVWKNEQGEYESTFASHMDAIKWVKRDSYLPVGSQGLKSVTKYKLNYDPKELDPELMTLYATTQPKVLADYSVSDAVATYYLYMKYVHPFIFSLCNIIPLGPDDVLRKGSGTLCEMLLMVQAYKANVMMPNKHVDQRGKLFDGYYLDSETYVGGHVEALESGVFRSDLPTHFRLQPAALEQLMTDLDKALQFHIEVEANLQLDQIENYDEIKQEIYDALNQLRQQPNRKEVPLIYHLDVGAMYPNIILTNRLQPPALVNEQMCAACDFNLPESDCQRKMTWQWRGEYFPADRSELNMIQNQIQTEKFPYFNPVTKQKQERTWYQLSQHEQNQKLEKRLSDYCRKVYKRMHEIKIVTKESIVCQRENPFYVDTVRDFRDRRYEYKSKLKDWKKQFDSAIQTNDLMKMEESKKMIVLMDSLQLAHKCILNSFYGYVMRKGSRWYSMEMAGIVCSTGANIIKMARELVERIGRPLELDTDGIWCILPGSFPENYTFKVGGGKNVTFSYPCVMLNHLIHAQFTNHQYQELVDPERLLFEKRKENSIFFEVDGPYRAMILPASKEEDKLLKKRYAVFNHDGTLAELKGFEVKRRGELKMIKIFQEEVFKVFLEGSTLNECYSEVAKVANRWLDILYSRGETTTDEQLLEYISENRSMSKTLEEYGNQKSTSITTAKRLSEFLGEGMIKDKGLQCRFIIAQKPQDAPIADRAIPVLIFNTEPEIKYFYLRKWLRDSTMTQFDIRNILDWGYYLERLGGVIQKLISIPAGMQGVQNPVGRVEMPEWFKRRERGDGKQVRIDEVFQKGDRELVLREMEDYGNRTLSSTAESGKKGKVSKWKKQKQRSDVKEEEVVELPDVKPSISEPYSKWLHYQKRKWKLSRLQRKHRNPLLLSDMNLSKYLNQQNLYLLSQPIHVLQLEETGKAGVFRMWTLLDGGRLMYPLILEIPRVFYVLSRRVEQRGVFRRVNKILPRNVSITTNTTSSTAGVTGGVSCTGVSSSTTGGYLYEVVIKEEEYIKQEEVWQHFFSHEDVLGVFERQVPLLFRGLLSLTPVVKYHSSSGSAGGSSGQRKEKGLDDVFVLEDFQSVPLNNTGTGSTTTTTGVNSSSTTSIYKGLKYIYLYCSQMDQRMMMGLFLIDLGKVIVYVTDPFQNRELSNTLFQKMYRDLYRRYISSSSTEGNSQGSGQGSSGQSQGTGSTTTTSEGVFEYKEELEIELHYSTSETQSYLLLDKHLSQYFSKHKSPHILLIQSHKSPPLLKSHLKSLNRVPYCVIPFCEKECQYPALDWQRMVGRWMIGQFFGVGGVFSEVCVMSEEGGVPVCNITTSSTTAGGGRVGGLESGGGSSGEYLSDILFARLLSKRNILLWYSDTESPDLGFHPNSYSYSNSHSLSLDTLEGETVDPMVSHKGMYAEGCCMEVEVKYLVLNVVCHLFLFMDETSGMRSIRQYHHQLSQGEGSTSTASSTGGVGSSSAGGGSGGAAVGVEDGSVSYHVFKCLRDLVKEWMRGSINGSLLYQSLLGDLHHWLSSIYSKLHDPLIYSQFHLLMRKCWYLLIQEFKQLGCSIVYGTFEKLILYCGKRDFRGVVGYFEFLVGVVKGKESFGVLDFELERCWDTFLFLDLNNYGGVPLLPPTDSTTTDTNDSTTDKLGLFTKQIYNDPQIDLHFILEQYLPPFLTRPFRVLLAKYILEMNKNRYEYKIGSQNWKVYEKEVLKRDLGFMREMVGRVMAVVGDIQKALSYRVGSKEEQIMLEVPRHPASLLQTQSEEEGEEDAALLFIKYICHLFQLYQPLRGEVLKMRKLLLMKIGMKEFDPRAVYKESNLGGAGSSTGGSGGGGMFVIKRLCCMYCQSIRDLDISLPLTTSTTSNTTSNNTTSNSSSKPFFSCPSCKQKYEKNRIEEYLLYRVRKLIRVYQMRDLKCLKCGMVKVENLRRECKECAFGFRVAEANGGSVGGATVGGAGGSYSGKGSSSGGASKGSGSDRDNGDESILIIQLRVLRNISHFYGFDFLSEVLDWILIRQ